MFDQRSQYEEESSTMTTRFFGERTGSLISSNDAPASPRFSSSSLSRAQPLVSPATAHAVAASESEGPPAREDRTSHRRRRSSSPRGRRGLRRRTGSSTLSIGTC